MTAAVAKPQAPSKVERWFPVAAWLPKYKWGSYLAPDLIAAISVAALLIPESMGYASVAGVPAQIGLYAAPLALVGYALFGGSRIMVFAAAGSVAAVSASVVGGLGAPDAATAVTLTAALALAAGAVFLVAGLAKMGWIANFMSKAVMAGFITGMAIQIIVGQLANLTGLHKASGNTFEKLWSVLQQVGQWNWTATVLGVAGTLLIFAIQRFVPKLPAALTAVVLGSIYIAILAPNVELVAEIPQGLPSIAVPTDLSASTWGSLLLGGCVVALVGFSEGWGSATSVAKKTHDDLNSNQEFRAYGIGLVGAGILGGMSTTGSLSKSSAALSVGAKSQMSNIILALIVLLTLVVLAPAFQWLPETILAAVVINAMWGSASPAKLFKLWSRDRADCALAVVTFVMVLAFDLLPAMIAGIILSIVYLVFKTSFPGRAMLGRDSRTGDFEALTWVSGGRKGDGNPDARHVPDVIIYRFDAPLIFSNCEAFKDTGQKLLIDAGEGGPLPSTLVIDCEEIFYADTSGTSALRSLMHFAGRYGVKISLARLHSDPREVMAADGVIDELGEPNIFANVHDAVAAATGPTPAGRDASSHS